MAAMLVTLVPAFLWWGAQLLREPAIWFLLAAIGNLALRSAQSGITPRRGGRAACAMCGAYHRSSTRRDWRELGGHSWTLVPTTRKDPSGRPSHVCGRPLRTRSPALCRRVDSSLLLNPSRLEAVRVSNALGNTGFGDPTASIWSPHSLLIGTVAVSVGPLPNQLPSQGLPALVDTVSWVGCLASPCLALGGFIGDVSWVLRRSCFRWRHLSVDRADGHELRAAHPYPGGSNVHHRAARCRGASQLDIASLSTHTEVLSRDDESTVSASPQA